MALKDALRKRYYAYLDQEDRGRTETAIEAYPFLNTLMVDVLDENPQLQERYLWGVIQAAYLATSLDVERISLLEFGVGRGDGIVLLERAAGIVERRLGVGLDVIGFDIGTGVPEPKDPRDMPQMYVPNLYRMDVEGTRARLERAELLIGPLTETVPQFVGREPAPVGFAALDFGDYNGTLTGLGFLDGAPPSLLPRVHLYFANVLGLTFGDCVGERAAIAEHNRRTESRPISPMFGLRHYVPRRFRNSSWPERYYMAHLFDHPDYGRHDKLLRHSSATYKPEVV
jgi:hypothetical protein